MFSVPYRWCMLPGSQHNSSQEAPIYFKQPSIKRGDCYFKFICASIILFTVAGNWLLWTSWKHALGKQVHLIWNSDSTVSDLIQHCDLNNTTSFVFQLIVLLALPFTNSVPGTYNSGYDGNLSNMPSSFLILSLSLRTLSLLSAHAQAGMGPYPAK